ncbi:MAG: transglutaminase-like domain-containing protein, partial [Verrucomicrobiales bacterium]
EPEVGAAVRLRELDLTDLEVRAALHTIRRRLPETGEGSLERRGLVGKYEIDYFDEVGKTRARFISDAHGQLLGGRVGGSVELRLSTAEAARKLTAGLDLFESSLIKIAVPLGNPSEIRALELEISGTGIGSIVDSPEQDAEPIVGSDHLLLKVGRKHGQRIVVTAEDRAESLEETSSYPTNDPQVVALVEKALGRATRPKARIKRLVKFVDEFIVDDTGSEPLTVNDIIDSQRGDCTEHSQLFVTMARAAGIPAREVSGFIYGEATTPSFGGHAWCEVEIDGCWHSVDPSWGETVINATHIRISGDQPSTEEMDLYLGGLKIRVLSVTDRSGKERRVAEPLKQP